MRVSVLNYIESTDTLVLICDGHLITHVSGKRPEQMGEAIGDTPDLCDRDVCLAILHNSTIGNDPADLVGQSAEYVDESPCVRFTGHNGGLISYTFQGEEKHVHLDNLALLHLKTCNGDNDMCLNLENSLLACGYETYILNGNTVSIIGCEVKPGDLERG